MKSVALVGKNGGLTFGKFRLDSNRLSVDGKPSFEEWEQCGVQLRMIEGAVQFWIGDWLNYGEHAYGEKYAQAVDETQADTWMVYSHVADKVLIRIKNLSWSHHREVAKFADTPDIQRELLEQALAESLTVSDFKTLIRARVHGAKVAAIAAGTLKHNEYDVICADPPWAYDNSGFDQSAANKYPTLDDAAICGLPTSDVSFPKFANQCVLFLWATSPRLPSAHSVMNAWGFDYKACMVWVKDRAPGLGWWLQTRHELLLIGSRGSSTPQEKLDSVLEAAVSQHSRKPDQAYAAIERMFPGLRRVEVFARQKREGWDVWGNEV